MADITVQKILDFLRGRGVEESVIEEFEKQKIDGIAVTKMNESHFEKLGLNAMGDRLALIAFCAPQSPSLDEKVERLKEALNSRGKRSGDPDYRSRSATVDGKSKKAAKATLKIEFGWKHYSGGKFMQVKKGKGGGNRTVDMSRTSEYEECLQKAQEFFFPNLNSQYGKYSDMVAHLGNYNAEKLEKEGFLVEEYKKITGMSLPRLYLLTKAKAETRVQKKLPGATHRVSDSLSTSEVPLSQQNNLQISQQLPVNFMEEDNYDEHSSAIPELSELLATDESLIQTRVAWCSRNVSNLEEPQLTEPHIVTVVFPSKFIRSTTTRTFKVTAVVKDLYTWLGSFPSVPSHFSVVLDNGTILKDLSQPLCQIGKHIVVEVLQIPPDVITGNKDLMSSELKCQCAICKEGLLPHHVVARPNNCLHMFHSTCIDEWLKVDEEGMSCPICETRFTSTITCSTREEPCEAQESQEPTGNNISAEAQPLVFEEYMDNGQEPVRLYEARTKEWEGLKDCTQATVNRDVIVEDLIKLYGQHDACRTTLDVKFLNEPAEDADGLTRELFSEGWKNILPFFFEGTTFHVPRVDPDCSEELFEILGRIASHGFVLTGYFPVGIAPASIIGIFDYDSLSDADLIYSFLSFLTEGERAAVEKAMCAKVSVDDILVDVLSRFNVREIPSNVSEFRSLFVRIAKCEFVTKPSVLMAAFKRGLVTTHPTVWNELNAVSIRALYARLYPAPEKVTELLQPSQDYMPLTARRDRVFEFLRRYVRSLPRDKVPIFLQFVTGSSLVLVPHIEVAFTTLSGIQRRPIAHTCSCRVDLSTEYESFAAFCKEFDTIISKEECFQYNAI